MNASGIYPYPKGLQNGNWKTDELKTVTVTTIKAPTKKKKKIKDKKIKSQTKTNHLTSTIKRYWP